jgi:hypothetical protein
MPKIGRVNMTILIEDINDNAPVFERSNYKVVVSDSSPVGELNAFIDSIFHIVT